jgi:hypothetical protein
MKGGTALIAAVACGIMGCATVTSVFGTRGEDRFDAGVQALRDGDYEAAHRALAWVLTNYGHEKVGQRAAVLLAAAELDPRNPNRRIDVGADLASGYLRFEDRQEWLDPVAQTLYLLGLELGNAESEPTDTARPLPRLPGPTVTARIRAVEQERDKLARRVSALEEQLAEKQREIDRIRKTVKP